MAHMWQKNEEKQVEDIGGKRRVSSQPGFSFMAEPEGTDTRTGITEYGVGMKYQ